MATTDDVGDEEDSVAGEASVAPWTPIDESTKRTDAALSATVATAYEAAAVEGPLTSFGNVVEGDGVTA